jgi:DNA-binding transcriptional LysR family regulator
VNIPFNLRELGYFVAVAEEGQMTRAAARLHVAQPGLSQAIAKLEARAGTQLLERHARGVRLTSAGEAFFEKALAVVRATEEAASVLEPWARGETTLAFGFMPGAQVLARPIRRRFMERANSVDVQIHHLAFPERLASLRAGRIDVELVYPAPDDPDLVTQTVVESRRYVALSERHRLAAERELVFEQIAEETVAGRHPSVPEEWARQAWLMGYRGFDPPVTPETPLGVDELWALIYSNRAIAVLPEFLLAGAIGHGVCAIPLLDVEPLEVVLARRRSDRRQNVETLFAVARELAGEKLKPPGGGAQPGSGHPRGRILRDRPESDGAPNAHR